MSVAPANPVWDPAPANPSTTMIPWEFMSSSCPAAVPKSASDVRLMFETLFSSQLSAEKARAAGSTPRKLFIMLHYSDCRPVVKLTTKNVKLISVSGVTKIVGRMSALKQQQPASQPLDGAPADDATAAGGAAPGATGAHTSGNGPVGRPSSLGAMFDNLLRIPFISTLDKRAVAAWAAQLLFHDRMDKNLPTADIPEIPPEVTRVLHALNAGEEALLHPAKYLAVSVPQELYPDTGVRMARYFTHQTQSPYQQQHSAASLPNHEDSPTSPTQS